MKLLSEQPPKYLNEEFFKTALEDGLREMRVEIKKVVFSESSGSGAGENYCSKIYRARALYRSSKRQRDEELQLIVKIIAITPATQFLEELAVYLREKVFYFDVLGKLQVLIGDGCQFGAKCLHTTRLPIQTIVFDDLTQYGYKLASRQCGLNEEHCVVVLTKLAKFHASSMLLAEKDPALRAHFISGMLDEHYIRTNERFIKFMTLQLSTLASLVSNWPGHEQLALKLQRHCDNIKENLVRTGRSLPGELTVLNHGDLWVNNVMFKYHDQLPTKPMDAIFVDFQNSFFGSPGCDINFFLNSSVQLDVLIHRREFLIQTYYASLRQSLEQMHSPLVPSFEEIQHEIHARELYGFFSAYAFLPMVTMKKEHSHDISIEALTNEEFAKQKVQLMFTSNPRTMDTLRFALRRFDELGIFD
ncbi:CG9497 [Drosophila busckii]|uniref:CG9497 n=2 Tax=Drosophila busckii TaxID=30019 RepID=A0A0M4F825_DROBS|nr:CG9497 [Drosophila busckii]